MHFRIIVYIIVTSFNRLVIWLVDNVLFKITWLGNMVFIFFLFVYSNERWRWDASNVPIVRRRTSFRWLSLRKECKTCLYRVNMFIIYCIYKLNFSQYSNLSYRFYRKINYTPQTIVSVSYTHLDVYKRQLYNSGTYAKHY